MQYLDRKDLDIDPELKYYIALKDSFMWEGGAILQYDEDCGENGGYYPLNKTDAWDNTSFNQDEYISAEIIEASPTWFARVYPLVHKDGSTEFVSKVEQKTAFRVLFTQEKPKL